MRTINICAPNPTTCTHLPFASQPPQTNPSFVPAYNLRYHRTSGVATTRATVKEGVMETTRTREELKKGIAELYDESSGVWEDIWGDHMHHGYYDPKQSVALSQHRAAQIRMIDQALHFAGVSG